MPFDNVDLPDQQLDPRRAVFRALLGARARARHGQAAAFTIPQLKELVRLARNACMLEAYAPDIHTRARDNLPAAFTPHDLIDYYLTTDEDSSSCPCVGDPEIRGFLDKLEQAHLDLWMFQRHADDPLFRNQTLTKLKTRFEALIAD